MYNGVGVRFADFISFFLTKVSLKPNYSPSVSATVICGNLTPEAGPLSKKYA